MNILYLPPIPYRGLKQRPQYIAEGLSKIHNVLYIDPTVSFMKSLIRGNENSKGYKYSISKRLQVLRLNGFFTAHRSLEAISRLFCVSETIQLRKYLCWADIIWVGYAPWFSHIQNFQKKIIYDKMDDDISITSNHLTKYLLKQLEPMLISRADTIFVTAKRFYNDIVPIKKRTFLVANAVDIKQAKAVYPSATHVNGEKIFGYVGMISHWFDLNAILAILDADNKNEIILVGPEEITRLKHPRLHYIGFVPKKEVGRWISKFDVCLYPFKKMKFLDTINPVKIYEYLAANKPILAIDNEETRNFGSLIRRYSNIADLRESLTEEWKPPFSSQIKLKKFIQENVWENRMKIILKNL